MKKYDIILANTPYTDLSDLQLRPALVMANLKEDLLICFISSRVHKKGQNDILLKASPQNKLKVDSIIRCGKIFSLHHSLAETKIGMIDKKTYERVVQKIMKIIQ